MIEVSVINNGIQYLGLLSKADNLQTIVIHVHGMDGSLTDSSYYRAMHSYYVSNNISFLIGQHSGSGLTTLYKSKLGDVIKGTSHEIFEDCISDINSWVDYAQILGYKNIWLQGHSLGTPKVAYYYAKSRDPRISGLVLISPSDMNGLVHDPIGQKDYDVMYPEATKLTLSGKGNTILKHKLWEDIPMSARTFLSLFGNESNAAVFNYANPNLGWDVVNQIDIPVLAITGTKDDGIETVIDPYEAMRMLKSNLIKCPRFQCRIYENATHDFDGFESKIVKDVVEFIQQA